MFTERSCCYVLGLVGCGVVVRGFVGGGLILDFEFTEGGRAREPRFRELFPTYLLIDNDGEVSVHSIGETFMIVFLVGWIGLLTLSATYLVR